MSGIVNQIGSKSKIVDGNIGIGTSAAAYPLHSKLSANGYPIVGESVDGNAKVGMYFGTSDAGIGTITSTALDVFAGGSTKMTINTTGQVDVITNTSGLGQCLNIINSGNDSNRQGIKIRCGTDDGTGTNYDQEFYSANGTLQGSITHSSGTVSYNTFTASHDAELPDADNDEGYPYGTLVEQTGIFYTKDINGNDNQRGITYKAQKSSSAYSKSVLGAYSSKHGVRLAISEVLYAEGDELPEEKSIGDVKTEAEDATHENLHQVYVLGDGHIICNGEKGNISVGDGICTSSIDGEGMKADKMTMIIGIAQEDVSFSANESKLVVVQYGLQQFTTW